MQEKPQRPVATGIFAKRLFKRLWETTTKVQYPEQDANIFMDYLVTSLTDNPGVGVRKIRIRIYSSMENWLTYQPNAEITARWLNNMQTMVDALGASQYVKFYTYRKTPSIAIWYQSHT